MNAKMLLLAILLAALVYFVFVVPLFEQTGRPVIPRGQD
jgi:type II secretory pathway component PulM